MLLLLLLVLLKKGRLGRSQDSLAGRGSRGPRGSGRHCRRGSMEHTGSSALGVQIGVPPWPSLASGQSCLVCTCFWFVFFFRQTKSQFDKKIKDQFKIGTDFSGHGF